MAFIKILVVSAFVSFAFNGGAQSKKEVKKHNIKTSAITNTENGKISNESKTTFDSKGNEIEVTEYNKELV